MGAEERGARYLDRPRCECWLLFSPQALVSSPSCCKSVCISDPSLSFITHLTQQRPTPATSYPPTPLSPPPYRYIPTRPDPLFDPILNQHPHTLWLPPTRKRVTQCTRRSRRKCSRLTRRSQVISSLRPSPPPRLAQHPQVNRSFLRRRSFPSGSCSARQSSSTTTICTTPSSSASPFSSSPGI